MGKRAMNRTALLAAVAAGAIGLGAAAWYAAPMAAAQEQGGAEAAAQAQADQQATPTQAPDDQSRAGPQADDAQPRGERGDRGERGGFRGDGDGFRGDGFRGDRDGFRGRYRDMGGPGMGGPGMYPGGWPADRGYEQWEDVSAFIREHSPKRWEQLQRLPEDRQGRVQWFILARYRNLDKLRENDPEVYELRLRRLKLEDDIFGMTSDLHARGAAPTAEQRKQLREQVTALVDLSLQEREKRIARLQQQLEAERKRLEGDRSNRQTMVERRLREIETQGGGPLLEGEDRAERPRDVNAAPSDPQ